MPIRSAALDRRRCRLDTDPGDGRRRVRDRRDGRRGAPACRTVRDLARHAPRSASRRHRPAGPRTTWPRSGRRPTPGPACASAAARTTPCASPVAPAPTVRRTPRDAGRRARACTAARACCHPRRGHGRADWIDTLLAPLAVGGSVVFVAQCRAAVLDRRADSERVTHRL